MENKIFSPTDLVINRTKKLQPNGVHAAHAKIHCLKLKISNEKSRPDEELYSLLILHCVPQVVKNNHNTM